MKRAHTALTLAISAVLLATLASVGAAEETGGPKDPSPLPTPIICTGAPPYTPTICIPPN